MEKKITIEKAFERLTFYDLRAMRWVLGRPRAATVARVARQVSRLGDGPAYALLALGVYLSGTASAGRFVAVLARLISRHGNRVGAVQYGSMGQAKVDACKRQIKRLEIWRKNLAPHDPYCYLATVH